MARMGEYLGAVGVIALIMGGIGVAMIIGTFMAGKLDTIAILNCLGARPKTLFKVYLLQALLLGFVGSVLGVALGYGLQFLLPGKLEGLLNIQVEPKFLFGPAMQSLSLGMATTFLFCLWPLVRAVKTKPLRLFRRNFEEEEISKGTRLQRWGMGLSILTGLALMVFWLAGSVTRGAVFLSALVISALVLRAMSWLILKLLRKLPPSKNMTHRYGLANLYRPNSQAVSIITCLGMGIMLVLTIRLVQIDMVHMLQSNTEAQPPNYFFIDIQSDQTQRFNTLVEQVAPQAEKTLTPLIRSRLHSAGERLAVNWVYKNPREEEWFLKRDFVLTYMAGPPPKDNVVIKGKWWSEKEAGTPQVSLEEDAAKRLGIDIGDELTMDIQGIKISAPVTSIRKVNWRNMRTNFYMIFSPGALEGAPITFVATVHVPEDKELELQHTVAQALPNITALSTRDIVDTVENVVSKLTTLVDFMSAFAIGAGLFILSGSVASTKFRRLKESAILKVLGARRKVVAEVLGIEYLALGAISGVTGIGLSMALSWAVMKYLVKSPWHAHPTALVWTLVLALILTTLTGTLSSLDVLRNKPLQTLRKLDG
jgi:putative ABC transport system permease protein